MGAGLLGIVTTGLYDDPLSVYREYIQNSADAAAKSSLSERARIDITIDVVRRQVHIRDNGPGLSPAAAIERLIPIGRSTKKIGIDRGFRGIGRLAGLAFAKTVSFVTRASEDETVTRVTWHSDRLPDLTSPEAELEQAIQDCVEVESVQGADYPDHFFDVVIGDVARHSSGILLNRDRVRDYIGEVCPVPLNNNFPFAKNVDQLFDDIASPLTLDVVLDGGPDPIERPYGEVVHFSATKKGEFTDFEIVQIPSIDGYSKAAIGWIAHSSYLGAIPKRHRLRGVRVRVGNLQIGNETVFDHLFAEERFNRWCIGELHVLDSRIVPNSKRDYFEPGPHLRNLENHLAPVLRSISTRCRRASTTRNRNRRVLSSIHNIEDLHSLATSGYLAAEDSSRLVHEAIEEVESIRDSIAAANLDNGSLTRLNAVEAQLSNFSSEEKLQRFDSLSPAEIAVFQRVFGALVTLAPSPGLAIELIESVLSEASKVNSTHSESHPDEKDAHHFQSQLLLDGSRRLIPS